MYIYIYTRSHITLLLKDTDPGERSRMLDDPDSAPLKLKVGEVCFLGGEGEGRGGAGDLRAREGDVDWGREKGKLGGWE